MPQACVLIIMDLPWVQMASPGQTARYLQKYNKASLHTSEGGLFKISPHAVNIRTPRRSQAASWQNIGGR